MSELSNKPIALFRWKGGSYSFVPLHVDVDVEKFDPTNGILEFDLSVVYDKVVYVGDRELESVSHLSKPVKRVLRAGDLGTYDDFNDIIT